jgi:hypothetical protein
MHELTCKLASLAFNRDGKPMITFEMNERISALAMADELYSCDKLSLKIDKFRPKRSLNANAYLWKLCDLIADKLSEDGCPTTKNEVYREAVKSKGIYREQGELPLDFAKTSRHAWEMLGTGWITEQVDFEPDGDRVIVRYYYGTSQYNSRQMGKVIDWLLDECFQLGIPTKSQAEIDSLLTHWGSNK